MKDILIRALKNFIQGFLSALTITLPSTDLTDGALVKSILIGALVCSSILEENCLILQKHIIVV